MHATNLGWAAHVAHHSSPDFNLSTALRQGAGESTVGERPAGSLPAGMGRRPALGPACGARAALMHGTAGRPAATMPPAVPAWAGGLPRSMCKAS